MFAGIIEITLWIIVTIILFAIAIYAYYQQYKARKDPFYNNEKANVKCPKCNSDKTYIIRKINDKIIRVICADCNNREYIIIGDVGEPIHYQCKECSNDEAYYDNEGMYKYAICTKCYHINLINHEEIEKIIAFKRANQIKCPYCNSTNLKKISTTSKVASTAVFGLAAMGKVNSNWHCNNCKSDF